MFHLGCFKMSYLCIWGQIVLYNGTKLCIYKQEERVKYYEGTYSNKKSRKN